MKNFKTFAAVALVLAACGAIPNSVPAENICVDSAKVYYGKRECDKPATVRAADCFAVIREWQEIQRRKLTQDDADYWILITAANARFRKAVEAVAKAAGNDMVAEQGSVTVGQGEAPPPDVTKAVVQMIKDTAEDAK